MWLSINGGKFFVKRPGEKFSREDEKGEGLSDLLRRSSDVMLEG